jgi:hypothetical protein
MEQFKIKTSERSIKIDIKDFPFLKELEVGYDFDFNIDYFHIWHDHQLHCLSLGFVYIAWKGVPFIDKRQ